MGPSKIHDLFVKLRDTLDNNPAVKNQLSQDLNRTVSNIYTQSVSSDEGYCYKFQLPNAELSRIAKNIGLTEDEVFQAYEADWGKNTMSNSMHSQFYYQFCLTLIYMGLVENMRDIVNNAFLLMMVRIWNGRKSTYLQFCNKDIMKYVVTRMCTNRHLFAKFDSPLSLIKSYFIPTLLNTYTDEIKKNPNFYLKRLFEQSYGRVNQLFVANMKKDLKTGKSLAQAGILPMYMKAKEEGWSISGSPNVKDMVSNDDEDSSQPSFDKYATINNREEIINTTTDYITMHPNPSYSQPFIQQINKDTKISVKVIDSILKAMHNHVFHDIIHDILSIILTRTNINEKTDICKADFTSNVKQNVISSKNNDDVRKLQKLINILLEKIFTETLDQAEAFKKYSNVFQIQLKTVIINGLVNNLRLINCKSN